MRSLRPLLAILSVLAVFAFVVVEAEARAGRGGSFGSRGFRTNMAPPVTNTAPRTAAPMERTMTQPGAGPQQAGRTAAAPAAGGSFFNRPGLLGGLAAGFLGAGLFGMLFGNGMFGGMSGFASMLGLLLQIGLVIIVARLAWAWWQRRQSGLAFSAPGAAQRSNYTGPDSGMNAGMGAGSLGAMPGSNAGAGAGDRASNGGTTPGNEGIDIGKDDYDAFENLLEQTQAAYSAEDLAALRSLTTAEMLTYFADDLSDNNSRGVRNDVSNVKLLQGDLAEAWREGTTDYATVAVRFSLVDKSFDRTSGQVVEGDDEPMEVTELWTFRRAGNGRWLLAAIQQS